MFMTYTIYNVKTSALLLGWLLSMARNPEIQKRGQEDVDKVLGLIRLPGPNDRMSMPYVEAMLLETMRWWTVTPLGMLPAHF